MIDNEAKLLFIVRTTEVKRREFLNWTGIGLLASFFPVALAACSGDRNEETSSTETITEQKTNVPNAEGFLAVGTLQDLDDNGYLSSSKSNVLAG